MVACESISCGGHKKLLYSGCILNLEQSGHANDFVAVYEKERTEGRLKNGRITIRQAIHT